MSTPYSEDLQIIQDANTEMLAFFKKQHISNLELIQSLKTELFELDIKLEEVTKTRNIYVSFVDESRNIFSPIQAEDIHENDKSHQLEVQLHDLQGVRTALVQRIKHIENQLKQIEERIQVLEQSEQRIAHLKQELTNDQLAKEEANNEAYLKEEGFHLITDEDGSVIPDESLNINHNLNLLMLREYEHTTLANQLETSLKDSIVKNTNKLEVLKWMLTTDVDRAKLIVKELYDNNRNELTTIDDFLSVLKHKFDSHKPIWVLLDEFVMNYRDAHPECVIEANVDSDNYEMNIHPIITTSLLEILTELFDNIFLHSNANHITLRLCISSRVIDVFLNDNGVGISNQYYTESKWYSGLHKVHETIHLLDGKISITGDLLSGTNIRFSFPNRIS